VGDEIINYEGRPMTHYRWWNEAYKKINEHLRVKYSPVEQRFIIEFNTTLIESVVLSTQLAYIMGFEDHTLRQSINLAKHLSDATGGITSLYVYAPDLIEPALVGDSLAPLLRIVSAGDALKDQHEENFGTSIQFHRLLHKDISEIHIELRTESGHLVPFDYGICRVVLQFKKVFYL
jgi:hypothetical protein